MSIFLDDDDRQHWLTVLGLVCQRYNFVVHTYCEMTNHYHLMLETVEGNLGRGMRQLNAVYSQSFNRRHRHVGHVLQGRYKAILVQKENYLLELARYIVLNPIRARMVASAEDWIWSSHRVMAGLSVAPSWLSTKWLLAQFSDVREVAIERYLAFVANGVGRASPLKETKFQFVLGDQAFAIQHGERLGATDVSDASKVQKAIRALSLAQYQEKFPERDLAMSQAYYSAA